MIFRRIIRHLKLLLGCPFVVPAGTVLPAEPPCPHHHCHIDPSNLIGMATCVDCQASIPIWIAIDALLQRLQTAADALEKEKAP